jgi:hypothetical protein
MTKADAVTTMPYKPSWIHRFFDWVDELPIPNWIFYFIVLLVGGAIGHLLAWWKGILLVRQFNLYLALSWSWLVAQLYSAHMNPHIARQALDEIRPLINLDDNNYKTLVHRFTMIPASPALLLNILGFLFGLVFAAAVRPYSPYTLPAFLFLSLGLTLAMAFVSIY